MVKNSGGDRISLISSTGRKMHPVAPDGRSPGQRIRADLRFFHASQVDDRGKRKRRAGHLGFVILPDWNSRRRRAVDKHFVHVHGLFGIGRRSFVTDPDNLVATGIESKASACSAAQVLALLVRGERA